MLTLEITYRLDENKPKEFSRVVQTIKSTLLKIIGGYSQSTDSAVNPTKYIFTSIGISEESVNKIKETLWIILESNSDNISIITK